MADAIRTRCKFRVVSVEQLDGMAYDANNVPVPGKFIENIKLAAQYDSTKSEDVSFAASTPTGKVEFMVTNPNVVGTFTPGHCYYLDLVPCDK
jgi:hypothetical protein